MTMMRESDAIFERLALLHPRIIDLSLDRIIALLDRLGRPQDQLARVFHVAGTNGKGSTLATLRAIAEAHKLTANVYTSPHLVHFNERIRLKSGLIDEPLLVDILNRCEAANAGAPITQFEITTVAALLAFAENPADVNLIEVGLGGEFDATNVFATAAACVITPIDFDHRDYLGHELTQIAAAKAGILKRGVTAIVGPQLPAALDVIVDTAAKVHAPLKIFQEHWDAREEHGRFVFEDDDGLLDLSLPRLVGRHQIANAGAAIAAFRHVFGSDKADTFERGLSAVEWPARLQRLVKGPLIEALPKGTELWLDGAHNGAGARALAEALADMEDRTPRPLYLICGIGANKDPSEILEPFPGLARRVFGVPIPNHTSFTSAEIAGYCAARGVAADQALDVGDAVAKIAVLCGDVPPRIVIFGSLYLAGTVLADNR